MSKPNYLRSAFLQPLNLAGLGLSFLSAGILDQPNVLLFALGLEGLYLSALSSLPAFRRSVRARALSSERTAEQAASEARLLAELAPSQLSHYEALAELKEQILGNYRRLPGGRVMAASSEARLNELLRSFLRLLAALGAYRRYLASADREALAAEHAQLVAELAQEQSERLREVKARRVDLLQRRIERFAHADESRELVSHQLAAIEDLMRLTFEQSVAAREPAELSVQLDALGQELQSTDETLRELERFSELVDEAAQAPHAREPVR